MFSFSTIKKKTKKSEKLPTLRESDNQDTVERREREKTEYKLRKKNEKQSTVLVCIQNREWLIEPVRPTPIGLFLFNN